MKRNKFIKHLQENSCYPLREGTKHSIYQNTLNGKKSTIPRHNDIKENLCKKICKDLGIPKI